MIMSISSESRNTGLQGARNKDIHKSFLHRLITGSEGQLLMVLIVSEQVVKGHLLSELKRYLDLRRFVEGFVALRFENSSKTQFDQVELAPGKHFREIPSLDQQLASFCLELAATLFGSGDEQGREQLLFDFLLLEIFFFLTFFLFW